MLDRKDLSSTAVSGVTPSHHRAAGWVRSHARLYSSELSGIVHISSFFSFLSNADLHMLSPYAERARNRCPCVAGRASATLYQIAIRADELTSPSRTLSP